MTSPTTWTLYASNEEVLDAIIADCKKAERSIVLEQFIFVPDDFGKRIIEVCKERARAGVDVRFLWDAAGSFSFLGSNIAEDLRKSHIRLLFWQTLMPGYYKIPNIRSWFFRNHRRTLVIDGRIGYTGSICIKDSMKGWRDTNARFEGPVVAEMLSSFDHMWARADDKKHVPRVAAGSRDAGFSYITNAPMPGKRRLYRAVIEAIRGAQKYIYITTPYFVPTRRMVRVIRLAALRGVDVRIILPERTDHYPALDIGARSFFSGLLQSGVRIFLYPNKNGGTLIHSKAIVVDGEWSTVGSLNLDHVSLLYNFEANVVSTNSRFTEEVAAMFVHDMNLSKEISLQEWKGRFFIEKLPEYAIRLVRKFL